MGKMNDEKMKKQIYDGIKEPLLTNDFIFAKVFRNEELFRELMRRILPEVHLGKLQFLSLCIDEKEKEELKGVAIDIIAEDEDKMIAIRVINDLEIVPLKVRYYQAMMDMYQIDYYPPHTRDFSRELGVISCNLVKLMACFKHGKRCVLNSP
ncbi:MAG: hypothetical protein IJ875_03840 [Solobacterium sp.]|nr:hypothetical protein [Solobacterium sp.]